MRIGNDIDERERGLPWYKGEGKEIEVSDQNGDRVSKSDKSCHICYIIVF